MRLLSVTGLALIAGAGLSACATSSTMSGAPTPEAQDEQAASELREHHQHHHRGGVVRFIAMGLDTLGVEDAKRPLIDKLQDDLNTCMATAGGTDKGLLLTLADGIAAGKIDAAKVEAAVERIEATAEEARDCSAVPLNQLYAALSPSERVALVDKVEAHWEVWRQTNHEAAEDGRRGGGRLADLSGELALTAPQVEQISAALHAALPGLASKFEPKRVEAHVRAFATAFVAESFDAKTVSENANAQLATYGARRMALFYETMAPLLTWDQRTKLAEHLREHASQQPAFSAK